MSTHSFVRVDCKAFAKCGVKSLSHCRRYRGEDNYCKGCTLIRRKPRNRKFDAGGREVKKLYPLRSLFLSQSVLRKYDYFAWKKIPVFIVMVPYVYVTG